MEEKILSLALARLELLHRLLTVESDSRKRENIKRHLLSQGHIHVWSVDDLLMLLAAAELSKRNELTKDRWLEFLHEYTLISTAMYTVLKIEQ